MIAKAYMMPHPPVLIPAVGQGQEQALAETARACHNVGQDIARNHPETIVLITPHAVLYEDYIHISPGQGAQGSLARFGAPDIVRVAYDAELAAEITRLCEAEGFPAGPLGEADPALDHGTLVPLHFVNAHYTQYRLVRCSLSGLSRAEHYQFGQHIRQACENLGRRVVLIASGDLSHKLTDDGPYGYAPEGPVLDKQIVDCAQSGDFMGFLTIDPVLAEKGAECGLRSFCVMAGALDQTAVQPHFGSYQGPFGVGYAVCSFTPTGHDPARGFLRPPTRTTDDPYVLLARQTLESYVKTGKLPDMIDNLPDEMLCTQAGVFVSLKKDGHLRGCIGTTEPTTDSVALEVMQNAISAGTRDPRFSPVQSYELDQLVYSVDVLAPPEPIDGASLLDVTRYGVIVTHGRKRGLLLPNLDGVDTVDEQLAIACSKAGIGQLDPYTLERFEVVRHQ